MRSVLKKLRELKLAGMVKSIDSRNKFALDNKISYIEFLELLVEDEYVNRKANSFNKRLSASKLNTQKTIENFDFNYQPELNKKMIMELASCRFLGEKKNIIFMGKLGVGKTHLDNAVGVEAIKQGYKVLFLHINDLIDKFNIAKADGTKNQLITKLMNADLIILDEIGFKRMPMDSIDDFFEIIRTRYELGSIVLTTKILKIGGKSLMIMLWLKQ